MKPSRSRISIWPERWPDGWRDARGQRLALAALAGLLALGHVAGIALTTGPSGSLVQGDARSYFAYLPSLVLDRDLDLRNQFEVLRPETGGDPRYPFGTGRDGLAVNPFPVGPALLWLPGYVIGVVVDRAFMEAGIAPRPLGYGPGAVWGTAIWSVLLAGLGAEFVRRLAAETVAAGSTHAAPATPSAHAARPTGPAHALRPGRGAPIALVATVMAWLGTPLLYYTLVSPLYSHAAAWFAVALMLWLTWRASCTSTRAVPWLWAGLAGGLVVAVRLQDAALLVVPVVALATLTSQARRRSELAGPAGALLGGLAVGYLPQAVTWYWLHGSWIPTRGLDGPQSPSLERLADVLLSTGYQGWWSWTPLAVPALAGLLWLGWRGRSLLIRRMAWAGLAAIAGLVLVDLLHPYGAGASFGGRRYLSALPLLALGLGTIVKARRAAAVLLALLTAWNLLLLLSYELLILRHDTYPTLAQTVRHLLGLGVG